MSTIAEIEAAVERLPRPDQENLLAYLVRKLGQRTTPTAVPQTQREIWLQQLDQLRAKGSALSQRGAPLQDVLDDIRAERLP